MKRFLKDEYCAASGAPSLKPLLQQWIAAQRDFTTAMDDEDYAWHYHERACVGFLAAAAWRTGGVALEEWRTEKGPAANPRKGRCDLYVYRKKGYNFHIEAKHMWSLATGRQPTKTIERKLGQAVSAADELQCSRKEKLGVLFIAPCFPVGKQSGMAERIAGVLETIHSVPHSAMAWLFRDRKALRPSNKYTFCPGIVLLTRTAEHKGN